MACLKLFADVSEYLVHRNHMRFPKDIDRNHMAVH